VAPGPISEALFRRIGQEIVRGERKPGERLLEEKLCEEYGCSRSPLREALRMLAAENLVTIEPRRGTRVAQLTTQDIADLFEVRVDIEALATRLAAERAGPEDIALLERLNEDMKRLAVSGDTSGYFDVNAQFHVAIAQASHNDYLTSLVRSAAERSVLTLFRTFTSPERVLQAAAKHDELIAALRAGDAELADRHMRAHIEASRDEAHEHIRAAPR
jgi:DNA-binding GntR family transcriptional regulator